MPVWLYPPDRWTDEKWHANSAHQKIKQQITTVLDQLLHENATRL